MKVLSKLKTLRNSWGISGAPKISKKFSWELGKYEKFALLVIFLAIVLRFSLASIHHVSGDACWILSVSRFVGENYSIPLFENLGRDSVFSRPPLFHIIAGIFYNIFGIFGLAAFGLKMVSPLSGSITLILFYFLIRKFYNEKITFIATTVLAFFPLHIYYSTISYIESTVGLFALLAVFFMVQNRLILSAIFAGLTVLLKFEGIFMIPVLLTIILYRNRQNIKVFLKKSILFLIISFILFMPYLIRNFINLGNPVWPHLSKFIKGYPVVDKAYFNSDILNLFDISNIIIPFLELFGVPNGNYKLFFFFNIPFINIFITIWLAATLIYFSFFVYGLIKSNKKHAPTIFILIWISIYIALVILTTIFQNLPQARFLVPVLPAIAIIWAIGINESLKIKKLNKIIGIFVVLIISGFVLVEFAKTISAANSWNTYQDDFDWIKSNTEKDSTVFYNGQCLAYNIARFTANTYVPIAKEYAIPKKLPELGETYVWVNQNFNLESQSILPEDIVNVIKNDYQLVYNNKRTGTSLYKIKD